MFFCGLEIEVTIERNIFISAICILKTINDCKLLVSGKTFFAKIKKGCFHLQDSALFRYLAVTTHIQITMGKSTHFIGQPLYSQVIKLLCKSKILQISED